jgi:hypothetical protein
MASSWPSARQTTTRCRQRCMRARCVLAASEGGKGLQGSLWKASLLQQPRQEQECWCVADCVKSSPATVQHRLVW